MYHHQMFRAITIFRGALISCVYSKTLLIAEGSIDNAAAVTLMSSDVDAIGGSLKNVHEVWANSFELGLAIYLLEKQVGVACVVTVILVICNYNLVPEPWILADIMESVHGVLDD